MEEHLSGVVVVVMGELTVCVAWATCDYSTQFESQAPSSRNDRVCSTLTTCTPNAEAHGYGQWTSVRNSAVRDRTCSQH